MKLSYLRNGETLALDPALSEEVAVRHYEWIRRGLEKVGRPATPYSIALAWNSGLQAAVTGRSPRARPSPDAPRWAGATR